MTVINWFSRRPGILRKPIRDGDNNQQMEMTVHVNDPHQVLNGDAGQPAQCLRQALDPTVIQRRRHQLPLLKRLGAPPLTSIRVLRYKPGRRCLLEYTFATPETTLRLMGKVRIKGFDKHAYTLNQTLWSGGFNTASDDRIMVPEPAGAIAAFNLWMQRKIDGQPLWPLLRGERGEYWGRRVAEAAHKLHHANIPLHRSHTLADELRILQDRLAMVSQLRPAWSWRLSRVLGTCIRLANRLPTTRPAGIHRDYYPDQLLAAGDELYILDLDLYSAGDPALDIGNFIGHTIEYSLRHDGDSAALEPVEEALRARFLQLNPGVTRSAVEIYTTLTLARHIQISTQFPQRQAYTSRLLDLCEQRLDLSQRSVQFSS